MSQKSVKMTFVFRFNTVFFLFVNMFHYFYATAVSQKTLNASERLIEEAVMCTTLKYL